MNESRVGVEITKEFIETLPANVDPCGENGEYHTFCFDGPLFKTPIKFSVGEKILKPFEIKSSDNDQENPGSNGFWFCDLIPVKTGNETK
ncbi:MAG: hypothetical protein V4608_15770 [Bacteroidota bacterium]